MNKVEGNTLPCGYVMGVHGALASGIPGLKSETWGTLRVFPLALVGKENSHTGLSPYPSSTDALLFLELLASELRIACVQQRGVNDRAQNCFRLIPLASNSLTNSSAASRLRHFIRNDCSSLITASSANHQINRKTGRSDTYDAPA
jgi:hypothetical protein